MYCTSVVMNFISIHSSFLRIQNTMETLTNRYITIKHHIDGAPQESDFDLKSEALSTMESSNKEIIVKNLYVSVDPYQLNRMKSHSSSQEALNVASRLIPGQMIDAYGVGKIIDSGNPEFEKGDLVFGFLSWGDYSVIKEGDVFIRKLDAATLGFPLSYHVGVLAFTGFTAYVGLFEVCKPKKGEKVFVSAASGAVGNLVGQYAKLSGCYVVGSAGTQTKVNLLKEKLGFDEAFNYKEEVDLKSALKRYFPDGIDIYFDNVGGEMLEAAVANMKAFGRIAACGVISEYTTTGKKNNRAASPDMIDIVYKRITIRGFLIIDFLNLYDNFLSETAEYLQAGKIQALQDISYGLENIPAAFSGLFLGKNVGKKIIQVADDKVI